MAKKTFKQIWHECFDLYKSGIIELWEPIFNWIIVIPKVIINIALLLVSITLGTILMLILAPCFIALKNIIFNK